MSVNQKWIYGVLMLLLLQVGWTGHAYASGDKPKTLKAVIAELKAEAKNSLDSGVWLRTTSNYARESKLKFEPKLVFKELSKRLDKNPSVDAYVKWQLMGFMKSTDWKDQKPKAIYKLIMTMPPYVPFPKLPGSITSSWTKVHAVKGVSEAQVNQAKKAWEVYEKEIAPKIDHPNFPISEYRQAVSSLISYKSSMRSLSKLQDLEDMLEAGLNPVQWHGIQRKEGQVRWRPSFYFIGLRRSEDFNKGMEDLIRKKVRALQSMEVLLMQEPYYSKEYSIWKIGRIKDDRTMHALSKFEEEMDNAIKPVSGS